MDYYRSNCKYKSVQSGGVIASTEELLKRIISPRKVEYISKHSRVLGEKGVHIVLTDKKRRISEKAVDLIVNSSSCCQLSSIQLDGRYKQLVSFLIGDSSCTNVREFALLNCPLLREVIIGKNSFTYNGRGEKLFSIVSCKSLQSVSIGDGSFSHFNSMEIRDLPTVQSLSLGKSSFSYAPELSLKGKNK